MDEIYQPEEDSYLLADVLSKEIPKLILKNSNLNLLEIGSGSGFQLQNILSLGIKQQNIFSCDIDSESVNYCKKLGFNCVKSDLFENIKGKFDIIIFNPPYLPLDEKEPKSSQTATTGGKEGSEIINKFLVQAKKHLTKQGKVFLLTSSLTKKINWLSWKKKCLAKKKLFFEELKVWEVRG